MIPSKLRIRFVLATIAAAILAGCIIGGDKSGKSGSGIGDKPGTGRIFLSDGKPAVDARVGIYAVDYAPQTTDEPKAATLAFETNTDAEGRYRIDSLAKGEYNILAEKGSMVAYSDSVKISGTNSSLPSDTLRSPGSIRGRITMQPNHDPRTATVQVMGTNVFVNVDKDGEFSFSGMAQGTYSIRVLTTQPEYTPYFGTISVRSGEEDTLLKPLEPAYTGIPVVVGLEAHCDTMNSFIELRWNATKYRDFEKYAVYRFVNGASGYSEKKVGTPTDTVFREYFLPPDNPSSVRLFMYSVQIENKSGQIGLRSGFLTAEYVPRAMVLTSSQLNSANGMSTGILDTVHLELTYSNPGRSIRKVEWFLEDITAPIRLDSSLDGTDSLVVVWPDTGLKTVQVNITDDGGTVAHREISIDVFTDRPRAIAGYQREAGVLSPIQLEGRGSVEYGSIRKLEWDIGGKGTFTAVTGGDTVILAPATPADNFQCILRVTDNRGFIALDTLHVRVVLDAPVAHAGKDTLAELGGLIHLAGTGTDKYDSIRKWEWDIGSKGIFVPVSKGDTTFAAPTLIDTGFQCVLRVTDDLGNQGLDTVRIDVGPWKILKPLPFDPVLAGVAGNNFLVLSADNRVEEWIGAADEWNTRHSTSGSNIWQSVGGTILSVAAGSNIMEIWNTTTHEWDNYGFHDLIDVSNGSQSESMGANAYVMAGKAFYTLSPASINEKKQLTRNPFPIGYAIKNWTQHPVLPSALTSLNGVLYYAYGREDSKSVSAWVDSYDTVDAQWKAAVSRKSAGAVRADFKSGGKWYILGEAGTLESFDPVANAWVLKAPLPRRLPSYVFPSAALPDADRMYMVVKSGKGILMFRDGFRVEVWSFDIGADQWTRLPGFPSQGGKWSVLETTGGKIIVINGRQLMEYLGN